MIEHVVFDIGRVLIAWDPHLAYRDSLPDPSERTAFLTEICSPAWNHEQDRGRPWKAAEAELVARHPDREALIRLYRANWLAMVPHAFEESVAILRALAAGGTDVTLLTNFAPDTFAEAERRFPVLRETRGVTVSGRVGLVKPDRAIFDLHAARFGLDPAATLFVDDSPANVAGAIAAGWQAVPFTDAASLRRDLEARGLDPGGPA
ncbi:HAD family phosphatase [Aurantimonas sp. Leaf443]|uniref:HAD family hydrolase n=1 Tax=Aurantimonas sp. Leaf443 TaxID=1736378 RepID=UPI0006FB405D|nr:HAD family phosphatase [Aurantimonas sp. Leaf443]KQT88086.1 2-haloalkanoic acid dehalogenase [Aurantimonas sp. Leaf443]